MGWAAVTSCRTAGRVQDRSSPSEVYRSHRPSCCRHRSEPIIMVATEPLTANAPHVFMLRSVGIILIDKIKRSAARDDNACHSNFRIQRGPRWSFLTGARRAKASGSSSCISFQIQSLEERSITPVNSDNMLVAYRVIFSPVSCAMPFFTVRGPCIPVGSFAI